MQQIRSKVELLELRTKRGYLLNLLKEGAYLHRVNCPVVKLVNPLKEQGAYHSNLLKDALMWSEERSISVSPCKLCLQRLTYTPRPEKIAECIKR
jgi:hypothetical protein